MASAGLMVEAGSWADTLLPRNSEKTEMRRSFILCHLSRRLTPNARHQAPRIRLRHGQINDQIPAGSWSGAYRYSIAFGSKGLLDSLLRRGPGEGVRASSFKAFSVNYTLVVILVTEIAPDDSVPILLHEERDRAAADVAELGTDLLDAAVVRQIGKLFEQRRRLIELSVHRVSVTEVAVELRYVIQTSGSGEHTRFCHLRTNYLPADAQENDSGVEKRLHAEGLMILQEDDTRCMNGTASGF
jgi:hypothetical protein